MNRPFFSTALLCLVVPACGLQPPDISDSKAEIQIQPEKGNNSSLAGLPNVHRLVMQPGFGATFVAGDLGEDFSAVKGALGLRESVLTMSSRTQDQLGHTLERYTQQRHGLPVIAGDVQITRGQDGSIRSVVGTSWQPGEKRASASVDESDAWALVRAETSPQVEVSSGELVYLARSAGQPTLSWRFNLEGEHEGMPVDEAVFVDAALGTIAGRHSDIHSSLYRKTFDGMSSENSTDFELIRREGDAEVNDQDIDTAHSMAGTAYECFSRLFGRDSYDDLGSTIQSVAHYGIDVKNAFSSKNGVKYGDGFATPDVVVHEYAHMVTRYSANLVYENESGALNEAWSDIFTAICQAAMSDSSSSRIWTYGEMKPEGARRRYLDNPILDGVSTDHYASRYVGTEDKGGVHRNSGIANLAFYLLSEGGTHPQGASNVYVYPIGIQDAGQIFYRALTTYMSPNTNFLMARAATEQAADDLFGVGSSESASVNEAWAAVGVGDVPPQADIEEPPFDDGPNSEPDPWNEPDDGVPPSAGSVDGYQPETAGCAAGGQGAGSGAGLVLLALMLCWRKES